MLEPINVQNKTPAPIQITAEQLILESVSRMRDRPHLLGLEKKSVQEDEDMKFKRRQYWEKSVRRNLCSFHTYIRYARWEEDVGEIENARSVFERALHFTSFKESTVWNCYIDMELRHKQIQYARNILERAIKILPRFDEFWLKYARLEENIGNIDNARTIFQRWLVWEPPTTVFLVFVEFECRVKEFTNARAVFERLLLVHPFPESYLRYADFEIKMRQPARARNVFERGLDIFGEDNLDETFIIRFAEFEDGQGEVERARAIYKLGLSKLSESVAHDLYPAYLKFEKRFGGSTQIEDAVIEKKKMQYMEMLDKDASDYYTWFELCQLLMESQKIDEARDAFKHAASHKPPVSGEKDQWSRYVQLCLQWAIFEEKQANDPERARQVYHELITSTPSKNFTFSRMWILYAYFEIRQMNLEMARHIFGQALYICKKNYLKCTSIYRAYIDVESVLQNEGNIRKLYNDFIEKEPQCILAWTNFSKFEFRRGNVDAARKILERAILEDSIEEKDLLWKVYIDFEKQNNNLDIVTNLYGQLVKVSNKFSMWKDWITFEVEEKNDIEKARSIFKDAEVSLAESKGERAELRKLRVTFEKEYGTPETVKAAEDALPTIKDGELLFPEESIDSAASLLQAAEEWSKLEL